MPEETPALPAAPPVMVRVLGGHGLSADAVDEMFGPDSPLAERFADTAPAIHSALTERIADAADAPKMTEEGERMTAAGMFVFGVNEVEGDPTLKDKSEKSPDEPQAKQQVQAESEQQPEPESLAEAVTGPESVGTLGELTPKETTPQETALNAEAK